MKSKESKTVTLCCEECSKEFKRWISQRRKQDFCSIVCWRINRLKCGEKMMKSVVCEYCLRSFKVKPSVYPKARFCSLQCRIERQRQGENWKFGKLDHLIG